MDSSDIIDLTVEKVAVFKADIDCNNSLARAYMEKTPILATWHSKEHVVEEHLFPKLVDCCIFIQ